MTDFTPERLRELAELTHCQKCDGGVHLHYCRECDACNSSGRTDDPEEVAPALRAGADAMKLRNDLFALVAGWHAYHADPNNETLAPHETIRDWAERKYKEAHSG